MTTEHSGQGAVDTSCVSKKNPPLSWRNLHRGAGWALVALLVAIALSTHTLTEWGITEYNARWLGALAKIASAVFGGYRVSRDVLRIDPSSASDNPLAYATLQLARTLLIGLFALAVCMAV